MTKKLTPFEKRCVDCKECKLVKGKYTCEECFNQLCNEIDECPFGYTVEEVDEAQKVKVKVKLGAKAESSTERKKAERKPKVDNEKEFIISTVAEALKAISNDVEITNKAKIIEFSYENSKFTLNLSRNNVKLREKRAKE